MMPPASDEPLHADTDATVPDVTEHRDLTDDPDATVGEQQQPPDSPDQTIDDNGDPELTIGAPLHSGDVDDETIYADIEQTIEQQWRDSFTDETTPELTIKCDPQQTMTQGFEFSLKLREVSRLFVRQGSLGQISEFLQATRYPGARDAPRGTACQSHVGPTRRCAPEYVWKVNQC